MYDNRRGGSVFGAFLLGGLVGAVLGLLFAPRSGKETRDLIADRAEDYWGQGVEMYETGKDKAAEVYATGREKATEIYETGREKATEIYSVGRERVADQGESIKGKIDSARTRLQEQVAKSTEGAKDKLGNAVPAAQGAVDKAAEATKSGLGVAGAKAQDTLDFVAKKVVGEDEPAEVEAAAEDAPSVPEV